MKAMQSTYSVISILKKEKRQKNNQGMIMLRVTVNGKRSEISIKRKIDSERWDSNNNRVGGNSCSFKMPIIWASVNMVFFIRFVLG